MQRRTLHQALDGLGLGFNTILLAGACILPLAGILSLAFTRAFDDEPYAQQGPIAADENDWTTLSFSPIVMQEGGGEVAEATTPVQPTQPGESTDDKDVPDAPEAEKAQEGTSEPAPETPGEGPKAEEAASAHPRPNGAGPGQQGTGDADATAKGRTQKCENESMSGIRQLDDHTWTISRDLLDRYAGDPLAAERLAVLGWHEDDGGDVDGFRVGGLRCGNPLHVGGFKNGDVVHAVNGKPVHNLAQAIAAYRKFGDDPILRVTISRKGVKQVLVYHVV